VYHPPMRTAVWTVAGVMVAVILLRIVSNALERRWGTVVLLAAAAAFVVLAAALMLSSGRKLELMTKKSEALLQRHARNGTEPADTEEDRETDDESAPRPPRGPIAVRSTSWIMTLTVMGSLVLFTAASLMFLNPKTDPPRLSRVIGVALLAGAAGLLYAGMKHGRPVFVADRNGIEERREWFGGSETRVRVKWGEVARAQMVEQREKVRSGSRDTRLVSLELVLLDRGGNTLLEVPLPWKSRDPFYELADAIPEWTRLEVESVGR